MRNPRDFFKPLAIGAPDPLREVPVRPSRMIHFLDFSNEKMVAKAPDIAPQVDILSPANDTTVSEGDSLTVSVLATDDHGLASVAVRSWIVTGDLQSRPPSTRASDAQSEPQWAGEVVLSASALRPGDALHIVATATDASPWRLTSESREIVVRLPTLTEQRDAVRDAADSAVARASAVAAAQKELDTMLQSLSFDRKL